MAVTFRASLETPIGRLEVGSDGAAILAVAFADGPARGGHPGLRREAGTAGHPPVLEACLGQLEAYFRGERTAFDVPLGLEGTPFQRRVWSALLHVPYGRTTTYGELAAALGNPRSGRAVGGANHRNPVSIIVPCHRVVGGDGGLIGYGGGLWRKEWLLRHERGRTRG
ncbi:MAG TPA: methylated-DNA--[protein]-cysteine S-methyltransferase [Terriglobales bacterium]|nr:methylated-DNA--[protein]-cysteine S-methyltransferase [Terriglobales bacterium]